MLYHLLKPAVLSLLLSSIATAALAGGGPEGVLLVVNPQSRSSLTIANYYAHLRQIPAQNIVFIPWKPSAETADIDTFRERILLPVLKVMESHRVLGQIDSIIYSSDFPWGISLASDIRKFAEELPQLASGEKAPWPKEITPVGSLTGLTFLYQSVAVRSSFYVRPESNHYARVPLSLKIAPSSAGFRGNRRYGPHGEVTSTNGRRYFLSMMLGVTAGRGNTIDEVIAGLRRSATADATHPRGTIYFLRNSDIRSKVRHEFFPMAVDELAKLGVVGQILEGTVPLGKTDVQGLVSGTPDFNWKASGSTILPGAICENFTSYGGVMSAGASQTPLSEFLRYGAAASSGTVTEPYTILQKFPSPMIQVHYARGCTVAEAFYQSVQAPYQLLVVGDPLCRPWADVPQVLVTGVEPGGIVRGRLTLTPTATVPKGEYVSGFELYLDGHRMAESKSGGPLSFDTATLGDGFHELRIVAIGPRPIESQGRKIIPIRLANHDRTIEAKLETKGRLLANMPLAIAVRSPGSIAMVAMQGSRVVGRVAGEQGRIEIPADTLGVGPVKIVVTGLGQGDATTNVTAEPLEFTLD